MAKADGRAGRGLNATNMKVTMLLIKSRAMEYLHGQVEIFIKENIRKTREMDMVR